MTWINDLFGWNQDSDKKLKADYALLANLGISFDKEWQDEENNLLLLVEKIGLGG